MAIMTEEDKLRSPLGNMALATQAWRVSQQKPLSERVLKSYAKQEAELMTLGLDLDHTTVEHVDFGLPSSLGIVPPQLPTCHLEKCLTGTNDKLDEADESVLIETQTQEMSNMWNQGDTITKPTQNNSDLLLQMFPQYSREGIHCALQSCGGNLYDTVDLLLKLLPQENRQQEPNIISFSQSASSAVENIPHAKVNPLAMALTCPSTSSGNRKAHFCKRCGHQVPDAFVGSVCPNLSCSHPFQQNLRM